MFEIEKMQEVPERIRMVREEDAPAPRAATRPNAQRMRAKTLRVYPYGLNQSRIRLVSRRLGLPVLLVNDLSQADAVFTQRTHYRKRPQAIEEAERRGIPVYVLRNNTETQIENSLSDIFHLEREEAVPPAAIELAIQDARQAIEKVISGERTSVQLPSQDATIRKLQHQMAREANLYSRSSGSEPRRRVTIYSNH